MKDFGFKGFLWRWLFALLLVAISWNPSGYSFAAWLLHPPHFSAIKALCALILAVGWIIYIRASLRSLGPIGLGLGLGLLACLIWLFIDIGILKLESASAIAWILLLGISVLLAVGLSWSHVRRRLSGQVDTDDLDD